MQAKGRPKKYRIIQKDPKILKYSPRGKPGRPDEVDLKMEEFEAIRLIDKQGLNRSRQLARCAFPSRLFPGFSGAAVRFWQML